MYKKIKFILNISLILSSFTLVNSHIVQCSDIKSDTDNVFQDAFHCYTQYPFIKENKPYYAESLKQLSNWNKKYFKEASIEDQQRYRHLFLALQDVSDDILLLDGRYSQEDLAHLLKANVSFKKTYNCDSGVTYEQALNALKNLEFLKKHPQFSDSLKFLENNNTTQKLVQYFKEKELNDIAEALKTDTQNKKEKEEQVFKFFTPLHAQLLIRQLGLSLDQAHRVWETLEQQFDLKYLIMHETSRPLKSSYDLLFGENAQVSIPFMVWDKFSESPGFKKENKMNVAVYPDAQVCVLVGTGRLKWRFWHAGKSSWKNEGDGYDEALNHKSTGIEMVPLQRLWYLTPENLTDHRTSHPTLLTPKQEKDILYYVNDSFFNEAFFSGKLLETCDGIVNMLQDLTGNSLLIKTKEEIASRRFASPGIGFLFSEMQKGRSFQPKKHLSYGKEEQKEQLGDWRALPEEKCKEWAYETLTLLGYGTRGEGLLSDPSSEKSSQFSHCLRAFSRAHCPETWAFYPQVMKNESIEIKVNIIDPWETLDNDTQKKHLEWVSEGRAEGKAHILIHITESVEGLVQGHIPKRSEELAFFPEGWFSWKEGTAFEKVLDTLAQKRSQFITES